MDREKVIKGLGEALTLLAEYVPCEGYLGYAPGACLDAIELLKAQEPVEPIPGLWDRDIQLYKCGACGGEIGAVGIAKYCFHCGKAVKWE